MADKPDLGTKRTDPETGKKFYDLNRDPIVSPYTGKSYPRSFFETSSEAKGEDEEETEEELDTVMEKPEFAPMEETGDDDAGDDDIPDLGDDDDVDIGDDADDAFLPEEDEEEDDVSGIISTGDSHHHDDQ